MDFSTLLTLDSKFFRVSTKNQAVVALSSGEAEYYALVKSASVAIGIRELAKDLGVEYEGEIQLSTRDTTRTNRLELKTKFQIYFPADKSSLDKFRDAFSHQKCSGYDVLQTKIFVQFL